MVQTNGQFWNDECQKLSDLLWIPDELIHNHLERKFFKCENKNISFSYFTNKDSYIPDVKFLDIILPDNSSKKDKLYTSLHKKEITRMDKEIVNPNCKLSHKELQKKHFAFMDKINEKVDNLDGFIRANKIQILPSLKQKKIMFQWFYDTTCIYNKLVCHFTQIYTKYEEIIEAENLDKTDNAKKLAKLIKENKEFPISFKDLRAMKIDEFTEDYPNTPYCVIADTIKEFVSNTKGNLTKMIKGQIDGFEFKRRKINRQRRTISLESKYTTSVGFYPSILGKMKTNDPEFEWDNVKHDFKLIYDKYANKFYVHIPKYCFPIEISGRNPIIIGDPGERIFQAFYALDHVILIGENMRETICKRLLKIDKLKEKLNKPGKKKYNKKLKRMTRVRKCRFKRAINKHHMKLEHLQQELHHKTAIYLCENYDRIMVTDFSSKKVSSKDGDLDPMTKRVLGKLSHYKFRQCLQQKCEKFCCQYLEKNEAWTSKTCCNCGNIKYDLGSSEEYYCEKCKKRIARDINGAINIFIKNRNEVLA